MEIYQYDSNTIPILYMYIIHAYGISNYSIEWQETKANIIYKYLLLHGGCL